VPENGAGCPRELQQNQTHERSATVAAVATVRHGDERYFWGLGKLLRQTSDGRLDADGLRTFLGAGFELASVAMVLID
jgi:hypothetical protein